MRAIFTSGSVGRAPGNRRLYPEADQVPRRRFRRVKLSAGGTWPLSLALVATRSRFLELSLLRGIRKWDHPFRRVYLPA